MEKLRYVMYCRKSTDSEDRQVQSIEDQQRELHRLMTDRNITVIKTLCESGSAKKPGRSGFNEMIQMINDGKADAILCWKLNRLSRNPLDGGQIKWLLQNSIIKSILTPSKEYLPTDNVLTINVELGMADQYSLDLSKDVKRGLISKINKGWRPTMAPIGYINDQRGLKGAKRIFKDPDRFDIIRKMWDLMLTGQYTVPQIVRIANKEWGLRTISKKTGGRELSLSVGYRIFTNTFYYGEYLYSGEIKEGKHEPMITKAEFDRVQKLLGSKGKPRPRIKRLPFNGLIRCGECGGMITCEEKFKYIKSNNNELKSYIYHHCSKRKKGIECNQKIVKHEDLKDQIMKSLNSITISEEFLHWTLGILRENNEYEETERERILKNLQKEYQKCIDRIDNLIRLYIAPENAHRELLSETEYKEQKNKLMDEKSNLNSQIKRFEERIDDWLLLTEKTFNFATYAKYWFEEGDYETKTNILRCLGQNLVLKDQELTIELRKPFLIIKEGLEMESIKLTRLEPSTFVQNKRKNTVSDDAFSRMSWIVKEVRTSFEQDLESFYIPEFYQNLLNSKNVSFI